MLTIEALIAISEMLSPEECKQYIQQTMRNLCTDSSWRVRYMAADNFVRLAKAVGREIVVAELVTIYVSLLRDNESEVRVGAASQIPGK
jgi:serine/threonine-protein phosphatase 2A regulatory subunit A